MKNELESRLILSVFEKIRRHGEKQDEQHFLEGVFAATDFDGYNLYLSDANVQLQWGFHNQYHYTYVQDEHKEQFEKKLRYIGDNYQ